MLTTIPFSGFYESIHDAELDRALEGLTQDSNGDQLEWQTAAGDIERPVDDLWKHVNWGVAHNAYARLYTEQFNAYFASAVGIELRLKFDELNSPREYNFATDRIFCELSKQVVRELWRKVDRSKLDDLIRATFTSYDGFISYYDNSLDAWLNKEHSSKHRMSGHVGDVTKWDHNQVGTLLRCVFYQCEEEGDEYALIEDCDCNGDITNLIHAALTPEGKRIVDAVDRVRRAREEQDRAQLKLITALPRNVNRPYLKPEGL